MNREQIIKECMKEGIEEPANLVVYSTSTLKSFLNWLRDLNGKDALFIGVGE